MKTTKKEACEQSASGVAGTQLSAHGHCEPLSEQLSKRRTRCGSTDVKESLQRNRPAAQSGQQWARRASAMPAPFLAKLSADVIAATTRTAVNLVAHRDQERCPHLILVPVVHEHCHHMLPRDSVGPSIHACLSNRLRSRVFLQASARLLEPRNQGANLSGMTKAGHTRRIQVQLAGLVS
jgi:hypothetical protein